MKTLSVGEFKAGFSAVLQDVKDGKCVGVSYGKSGVIVAVLVSPEVAASKGFLRLGSLKGKARFLLHDDFKMNDEEILKS